MSATDARAAAVLDYLKEHGESWLGEMSGDSPRALGPPVFDPRYPQSPMPATAIKTRLMSLQRLGEVESRIEGQRTIWRAR